MPFTENPAMFAQQEGRTNGHGLPCPSRPVRSGGQALPDFFKGVGAARFGVMAGSAAAVTAFFLYVGGATAAPANGRRKTATRRKRKAS